MTPIGKLKRKNAAGLQGKHNGGIMTTGILKRAAGALTAAVLMTSSLAGGYLRRNAAFAAEEYTTWSQLDPRWSSVSIGMYNIGNSGCLITSLSIMAMHSGSIDDAAMKNLGITDISQFDPGVLANAYTARGGFNQWGGIASWGTISQIIPSIIWGCDAKFKSSDAEGIAAEIKELQAQGYHVIVNVNGHHWVYIEGVLDGRIFMFDPACDERIVTDYYTLEGQNEYWALKGKNPPPPVDPSGVPVKKLPEEREYFCREGSFTDVYSTSGDSEQVFRLDAGTVVTVCAIDGDMAGISDGYGGISGWIRLDRLDEAGDEPELMTGDINGDGIVDEYDLALLNDHLSGTERLPAGASILRRCEEAAGDLNCDGFTDRDDVAAYLAMICG